jgi:hypothetical protein
MAGRKKTLRSRFTTENTIFLVVDHQERIFAAVGDQRRERLRQSSGERCESRTDPESSNCVRR